MVDRQRHWNEVYATKSADAVSWYEEVPRVSSDLIAATGLPKSAAILDVGGGVSRLSEHLVAEGYSDITVLDLSAEAIARLLERLGPAARVRGLVADVTTWMPDRVYDLWHDRAVLHFLTGEAEQAAYRRTLTAALAPGGHVILSVFAPSGPERCSGLPVRRHGAADLDVVLGPGFERLNDFEFDHRTPWGAVQRFQAAAYRRTG